MNKKSLIVTKKLSSKQLLFIISSVIILSGLFGWIYEYIFYFFNSGMKTFYMRGGNFSPWINIYCFGAFIILFLAYNKREKPVQVFLISALSSGLLELISGYVLYEKLHWVRCWDYNQEILNFGNIGGYVCLRSVIVFGLCGLLLIYGIIPILIKMSKTNYLNVLLAISLFLAIFILIDEAYNLFIYKWLSLPKAPTIYKKMGFKYIYFSK